VAGLYAAAPLVAQTPPPARAPRLPLSAPDSLAPTREGFFREALDAAPTARTPRYDDYTAGSYHAGKLDLARGLPKAAARLGLPLQGLVVVGPVGPLWAYYVVTFVRAGDSVRVNSLMMPHARITGKATALLPRAVVDGFFRDLAGVRGVRRAADAAGVSAAVPDAAPGEEWQFDVLAVRFAPGAPAYYHASFFGPRSDAAVGERAGAVLNGLLGKLRQTYPSREPRGR
jgi:hypothetical protein